MKMVAAVAGLMALVSNGAMAHEGVKDPHVKARMDAMRVIGAQMKVIGTMAKGKSSFDADRVRDAANQIAEKAAKIPDLFGPEADDPKSEAKPAIWAHYEDFVMKAGDLEMAATEIADGKIEKGGLSGVVRQLGSTCQACHGEYRE